MFRPKSGICPSITESIASKLIKAQLSISDIITNSLEKLSNACGVSVQDLSIVQQQLIARHCSPIAGANNVYDENLRYLGAFSTGNDRLDSILNGGVMGGEIVELFGASGTGKTQMCFQLSAHVTSTTKFSVMFIDTCGSFSAQRIKQIMKENGTTEDMCLDALSRIVYQCCYDVHEFINIMDKVIHDNKQGDSEARCVQLIVIDSIASLIIPMLGKEKFDGLHLANRVANKLKILSSAFYKTILMTNEQVDWGHSDPRPALGQYWGSVPHIRLWFSKDESQNSNEQKRKIEIYKSTRSETGKSVEILLGVGGVVDYGLQES